ncbi:MAG: trehalose-phosphatase [Actinobacteria bacterium]|nr:trehalose-phosphatase [Actinomycetota bacterium]
MTGAGTRAGTRVGGIDEALRAQVERFVAHPVVLVASDYDGTLSELVDDPGLARPNEAAVLALRLLAQLPRTHVALVSGRSLRDLAVLSGLSGEARLVGSHGSEFEPGVIDGMHPGADTLLDAITTTIADLAGRVPGARVERKPASVAFHTRQVDPLLVPDLVASVLLGPGTMPGVSVKHGKDVVELTVVDTHKGNALQQLRAAVGADAVMFVGDDLTDEDAFTMLGPDDLGVKVGAGPTSAGHRVDDVASVAELLRLVVSRRAVRS